MPISIFLPLHYQHFNFVTRFCQPPTTINIIINSIINNIHHQHHHQQQTQIFFFLCFFIPLLIFTFPHAYQPTTNPLPTHSLPPLVWIKKTPFPFSHVIFKFFVFIASYGDSWLIIFITTW
jgi:hypothetical protein